MFCTNKSCRQNKNKNYVVNHPLSDETEHENSQGPALVSSAVASGWTEVLRYCITDFCINTLCFRLSLAISFFFTHSSVPSHCLMDIEYFLIPTYPIGFYIPSSSIKLRKVIAYQKLLSTEITI